MEPPRDEAELMERARALGGRTIAEVAREHGLQTPDLRRAKGFVGQLVERALGAEGGSRAEPDFPHLGVELKTLPVDRAGKVRESTFVCTTPIAAAAESEWASSRARAKLTRVLWLVVEAEPRLSAQERRFGAAFLWSPDEEEEALLEADWEELTGRLGAGEVERVDARRGRILQLRPKGADANARTLAYDDEGAPILAAPRGFYLRARFTASLLERAGLRASR
jgi:DNA mismatch repair protein MutH